MKISKKILMFIFMCMLYTTNVNAYSINVGGKVETGTPLGASQQQTISGGVCDGVPVYCVDKGLSNQTNFNGCTYTKIDASGNIINDSWEAKNYYYNAWAYANGLTRGTYSNEFKKSVSSIGTAPFSFDEDLKNNTNIVFGKPEYYANNTMAKITATVNVSELNLSSADFSTNVGNVSFTNNGNGNYVVVISGIEIKKCEGAVVTLKIKATVTKGEPGTYYVNCKNEKQNYVVTVSGQCTIEALTGIGGMENTTTIPDPSCDCSGSTNMTGLCNIGADSGIKQSYYVKDVEDNNIKKCVESGTFKKYCGESIKKENDNGKFDGKTSVSGHRTNDVSVNLADNPYCSVYCLEDINYDLPGVIDTQSATYFKLSDGLNGNKLTLTGKRTCYTDRIKKEQYVDDIINKQQEIIEAYNDYNRALAYEESKETCVSTTYSCSNGENSVYNQCEMIKYKYYDLIPSGNGSVSYKESEKFVDASHGKIIHDGTCIKMEKGKCVGGRTCVLEKEVQDMNLVPNYDTVEAHLTELDDIINKYKSCFEWTNYYCFNPKVKFTYNEVWDMDGELPGSAVVTNKEISKYFDGEPGDDYDSGSYKSSYNTITVNYLYPQKEKDAMELQQVKINMSSQYVSKSVTKSKTFEDSTKEVWEYKTSGVVTDSSKCKGNDCKSLGFVFPVSLQQDKLDVDDSATPNETLRTYTLDFENLGVPGNDAQCSDDYSRIMGDEGEKCSLYKTEKDEPTPPVNKDYVCVYAVEDCPDCPPTCICPKDDPTCYVEDGVCYYKDCPDCVPFCVGCIHSSGDITFGYKQVSLSDIFPNSDNTDVGYNWNTDSEINKNADKAEETIKEIEDKKEAAYTEPQYSFTLSPTTMAKIRAYNDAANEEGSGVSTKTWGKGVKIEIPKGGYTNDTLERIEKDGNNYKSTFIDGLITMLDKDEYKRNEKWEAYPGNGSSWK